MMTGADKFAELLEKYKKRPILLYGDPDPDGLFVLLLMCQFCNMLGLNYTYYVNTERYHGLQLKPSQLKGYLVIAGDFAITKKEMQELVDNDVVMLSTDHHETEREFIEVKSDTAEGIVINNQYPFEPEEDRYLSGTGVFYELACSLYPEFKNKEREAMVGITLLTDVREIENKKARAYLRTTYGIDSTQGYFKYLIDTVLVRDYNFGVPKIDRNFVDYVLGPKINSLLRFDKKDDAVKLVLGQGLPAESQHYREDQVALIDEMLSKAMVIQLPNIHCLAVQTKDFSTDVRLTNFIGLLCSNYKDKHDNVSTIGFVVGAGGKILRTSFRGKYDDVMYSAGFRNIGINAQGHHNAFGIPDFAPTDETWVDLNDLIGDLEASHSMTINVIESPNLMVTMTSLGLNMATENIYVRDMYRKYIKYTGKNIKVNRISYKYVPFTKQDYESGVKPDMVENGKSMKLAKSQDGKPIPKYIEYLIDGRVVKSFGTLIEDGYILPELDKGYIQLYVCNPLS